MKQKPSSRRKRSSAKSVLRLMGALEEATVEEARANFETNVIGTFSVVQAALPLMRRRGPRMRPWLTSLKNGSAVET